MYIYIYVCLLLCPASRNRGIHKFNMYIYIYIYISMSFFCSITKYLFNPICGLGLEEVFCRPHLRDGILFPSRQITALRRASTQT